MGMSSYVLDLEDQFYDAVSVAVKESEHISEAYVRAMESRSMVANWSDAEVHECVDEFWNDFWSKYG